MDKQRLMMPLAVLILACTPFVVASGNNDGVCDGQVWGSPGGGPSGEGASILCEIIAGPGTISGGPLFFGIHFCQEETTDIPLQCEGNKGDINGYGGATFGDNVWTGKRLINVDVTLDQQTCTDFNSPPCGFTVNICNDRDHDSFCNLELEDEYFRTSTSERVVFGECQDQKKDCADPNEAGWEGCMNPSVFDDWIEDQIIVFIGAEVGPTVDFADFGGINPDNVTETILNITSFVLGSSADAQAAIVVGTFTVWMEDKGSAYCDLQTGVLPACRVESRGNGGEDTIIEVSGSAGTVFTCTGRCPTDGDLFNVVQWNEGPGTIYISMEGCGLPAGSAPAYAHSQSKWGVSEGVQTQPNTFTCRIEILYNWARGIGGCNDPPRLPI